MQKPKIDFNRVSYLVYRLFRVQIQQNCVIFKTARTRHLEI